MTALNTKTFTTMVTDQITSIQAKASQLINFTIGSVLRALVETNAAVGLWLQGMIVQLLGTTRASTSSGSDLDTWMADYGVFRLPATAAMGFLTFSRFTATAQAIIPFGTLVQTPDGLQQFAVSVDLSNAAYTPAGYVIAAGTTSVTVPAVAVTAAAAGNVGANQITALGQSILYVDTVNNALAFVGGSDAEQDPALRSRFVLYIASLARATVTAVKLAATSVQPGLSCTLTENQQYNGTADIGYFYVVLDDGSGAPPTPLIAAVSSAIDAVRAITTRFGVFAPVVIHAAVTLTVTLAAGAPSGTRTLVQTAIQNYINALGDGVGLAYSRLIQVAYDASPSVVNVSSLLINGGTADLSATGQQVIKYSTVVVS
jgi:uncharacterized phage protein gp47/JayE